MRVLLLEDDAMIGASLRKGLRQAGFAIDWFASAEKAEQALASGDFDLLLLDLGLPGKDGLDLLRTLRERGDPLPVLVVTARDAVPERIKGLNAGADDYVVKPFDLDELIARMHALLRRRGGAGDPVLRHGRLALDPITRTVTLDDQILTLSAREFALLHALLIKPGAVLSTRQLQEKIYDWDAEISSNAIEVHIHSLRKKLGADFIRNLRGVGYMIPPAP